MTATYPYSKGTEPVVRRTIAERIEGGPVTDAKGVPLHLREEEYHDIWAADNPVGVEYVASKPGLCEGGIFIMPVDAVFEGYAPTWHTGANKLAGKKDSCVEKIIDYLHFNERGKAHSLAENWRQEIGEYLKTEPGQAQLAEFEELGLTKEAIEYLYVGVKSIASVGKIDGKWFIGRNRHFYEIMDALGEVDEMPTEEEIIAALGEELHHIYRDKASYNRLDQICEERRTKRAEAALWKKKADGAVGDETKRGRYRRLQETLEKRAKNVWRDYGGKLFEVGEFGLEVSEEYVAGLMEDYVAEALECDMNIEDAFEYAEARVREELENAADSEESIDDVVEDGSESEVNEEVVDSEDADYEAAGEAEDEGNEEADYDAAEDCGETSE